MVLSNYCFARSSLLVCSLTLLLVCLLSSQRQPFGSCQVLDEPIEPIEPAETEELLVDSDSDIDTDTDTDTDIDTDTEEGTTPAVSAGDPTASVLPPLSLPASRSDMLGLAEFNSPDELYVYKSEAQICWNLLAKFGHQKSSGITKPGDSQQQHQQPSPSMVPTHPVELLARCKAVWETTIEATIDSTGPIGEAYSAWANVFQGQLAQRPGGPRGSLFFNELRISEDPIALANEQLASLAPTVPRSERQQLSPPEAHKRRQLRNAYHFGQGLCDLALGPVLGELGELLSKYWLSTESEDGSTFSRAMREFMLEHVLKPRQATTSAVAGQPTFSRLSLQLVLYQVCLKRRQQVKQRSILTESSALFGIGLKPIELGKAGDWLAARSLVASPCTSSELVKWRQMADIWSGFHDERSQHHNNNNNNINININKLNRFRIASEMFAQRCIEETAKQQLSSSTELGGGGDLSDRIEAHRLATEVALAIRDNYMDYFRGQPLITILQSRDPARDNPIERVFIRRGPDLSPEVRRMRIAALTLGAGYCNYYQSTGIPLSPMQDIGQVAGLELRQLTHLTRFYYMWTICSAYRLRPMAN